MEKNLGTKDIASHSYVKYVTVLPVIQKQS